MEIAIEIRDLKKYFGDRKAVDGVSLEIQKGECFGLIGPNGAGKTTLLRMLSGSVEVQSGDLFMLGIPIQTSLREIKSRMGVVPQGDGLDTDLSVRENLIIFGSYFGLSGANLESRVLELLRSVSLEDRADESVDTLSGGLKRRLAIVRALLSDPELLILDEPTASLDPRARFWIWDFLREKKKQNKTVVLTTHYMDEAEALCDRIGLLHNGKLLDVGTPDEVIARHWGKELVEFVVSRDDTSYYLNRLKEKKLNFQLLGQRFFVAIESHQNGQEIMQSFKSTRVTFRKPDLNDVFLKLTGSDLIVGGGDEGE